MPDWHDEARPLLGELSDKAIAERVGVSWQSVQAWRLSLGIEAPRGRGRPRKGLQDLEQEHPGLLELLASGPSSAQVGAFCNRSRSWGHKVLQQWRSQES